MTKMKIYFPVILLSLILTALLVSFFFERQRAQQVFTQYIAVWEDDIAANMVFRQDHTLASKVISQLKDMHQAIQLKSLSIGSSYSENMIQSCVLSGSQSLTLNGMPVGKIQVCYDLRLLLLGTVFSPIFTTILIILLFGLGFYYHHEWKNRIEKEMNTRMAALARQVAHDIRGPLMALNVVTKKCVELDVEKRELLLGVSDRINQIANDLLHRSKQTLVETPQVSKTKAGVAILSRVLDDIISEFKVRYPGIIFNQQIELSHSLLVGIERGALLRMLSNILQNAVEASSQGQLVRIQAYERQHDVCIVISDEGMGMSEDQLEQVRHGSVTFKKDGNGLGLSSVREQLARVGGETKIYSKENIGTQVQLIMPKIIEQNKQSLFVNNKA